MKFSVSSNQLLYGGTPCIHLDTQKPIQIQNGYLVVSPDEYLLGQKYRLQAGAEYRCFNCPTVSITEENAYGSPLMLYQVETAKIEKRDVFSVSSNQLLCNNQPCIHTRTQKPILIHKGYLVLSKNEQLLDPRPNVPRSPLQILVPECVGCNYVLVKPELSNKQSPLQMTDILTAEVQKNQEINNKKQEIMAKPKDKLWLLLLLVVIVAVIVFLMVRKR